MSNDSIEPRLEVRGLHKSYNVPVLMDLNFSLKPGEVHALVGSNGAGKSTLARILCGLTSMDAGNLLLDGQPYRPAAKRDATGAGVVMVLQELNVIPTLSVAENLFLDRLPGRFGVINRRKLNRKARMALDRIGLNDLDPETRAGDLGVGRQQLVEIAAALSHDCRVLILDEPTAALTSRETEELFQRMRDLQERGVAILFVSHRMDEVRTVSDRVTVLRDGRCIATHDGQTFDQETVIRQMAGEDVLVADRGPTPPKTGKPVLELRGLRREGVLHDLNLQVNAGEVLGVSGLVGAGRSELLRAVYGADRLDGGEVRVLGEPVRIRHPKDAVKLGIGMVPEDRKSDGLLLSKSIIDNATLASHRKFSRRGVILTEEERNAVEERSGELKLKHAGLDRAVAELSGGNQQKTIMLRWLLRDCPILLLDEPTRGIDVAAKATIHQLLRSLAASGRAIVMVSSELPELMANCDRIVVLSAGRITGEFYPDDWSEERITAAAFAGYLGRRDERAAIGNES